MGGESAVVVVDDQQPARRSAAVLGRAGYDVRVLPADEPVDHETLSTALSGWDGGCVVTELDVADRPGLGFAASVRSRWPDAAIVVCTDDGDEATASRAFTVGADEYVRKSAGHDALVVAVERALSRRRAVAERDRYRTVVESVGDLVYALDDAGRIAFVNRAFAEYFDVSASDVVGADVADLLPEAAYEDGLDLIQRLVRPGESQRGRYEFRVGTPAGDERVLENNLSVLVEDGRYEGSVGVIRDVTERVEDERRLEAQNEQLDEFASIVGHDLRNPLNVISGRVALLRETGDEGHLDQIDLAVDRMEELLGDLLTLSREGKRVDDLRPVPLEVVAVEAWQSVDTTGGRLVLADDLGTIRADRSRLRQCFENLFRNAVEHGSTNPRSPVREGAIEHGTPDDPDGSGPDPTSGDAAVTVTVEGTDRGFAVADDGPGIDPDQRAQVFDRGFTSSEDGTGFGLSIVSRIVDAHGWSIRVDEAYDRGARFVVDTVTDGEAPAGGSTVDGTGADEGRTGGDEDRSAAGGSSR